MKLAPFALIALGLVLAMAGHAWWAWMRLPPDAVIATHFGADGEPNGWMPKAQGLLFGPVVGAGLWLLLMLLPRISRRPEAMAKAATPYGLAMIGGCAILLLGQAAIVSRALGGHLDVTRLMIPGVGVLLAVLGNYMGKVRQNEFMGVRTPWTLMDAEVWDRTQRFTGRLMLLGGLGLVAIGLIRPDPKALTPLVLACAVVPPVSGAIYSWAISKPKQNQG
ncbi:SdpI family protein [Phenylobacterium montanum]|uniref:SdpI family protein n=1 Tax=Phenylobacterium montanum TaxID=2823693 RepID=A0A975IT77_9CAUL|nr:SdpI family protein [Caulobacter sp. S6]QUD86445.1 SdpI family protein [Caulobacter sp. S6]